MKKRTVLIDPADELRIAQLIERHPFASAHAVARIALHIGLEELEQQPERLIATRSER